MLSLLLLLGWAAAHAEPPDLGSVRASGFEVTLGDGTRVPLASLLPADRPAVVEFWATWCSPCRKLTPSVQKLYERYDSEQLTVLGLTVEDFGKDRDKVAKFLEEEGVTFPIGFASDELFLFMNEREEVALPKVLVYDADGGIRAHITSYSFLSAGRIARAVRHAIREE